MDRRVLVRFEFNTENIFEFVYDKGPINALVILDYLVRNYIELRYPVEKYKFDNEKMSKLLHEGLLDISNVVDEVELRWRVLHEKLRENLYKSGLELIYTVAKEDTYINPDNMYDINNMNDSIGDDIPMKIIYDFNSDIIVTENIINIIGDATPSDLEKYPNLTRETSWFRGYKFYRRRLLKPYIEFFSKVENHTFTSFRKLYKFNDGNIIDIKSDGMGLNE